MPKRSGDVPATKGGPPEASRPNDPPAAQSPGPGGQPDTSAQRHDGRDGAPQGAAAAVANAEAAAANGGDACPLHIGRVDLSDHIQCR